MANVLARDDRQSVMQIGSYRTDKFENINGISGSVSSSIFEFTTSVRVKSYGGDNWVSRFSATSIPEEVVISAVGDAGFIGTYTKTTDNPSGFFTGQVYKFVAGDTYWMGYMFSEDRWVVFSDIGVKAYEVVIGNNGVPPVGTWVPYTGATFVAPAGTATVDAHIYLAVSTEGLLLEVGEELTTLLYPGDLISTIGGKLNIVPIEK